jgi:hypothetical protein
VDSENSDYVIQRIRDKYIKGSSCTLVLCGNESSIRKYIDWEIKATLEKEHGLIGIALPTCRKALNGACIVPNRLYDNIISQFSTFIQWSCLFPQLSLGLGIKPSTASILKSYIDQAVLRQKTLIVNTREIMKRNGEPK